MRRKQFLKSSVLFSATLSIGNFQAFANVFLNAGFQVKMLSNDIGIFTEKGGTILFYLSAMGNVIVDTQFPDSVAHCIDELKKMNKSTFDLVINTHHHGDHTSGNIAFKSLAKRLLAHENSKSNQEKVAKERNTEATQWYPTETFEKTWKEKIDTENIQLNYFGKAHTNGDAVIYFKKAGIAHLGDLVFNRRHPYVDRSAGASIKNWIMVLNKIATTYPDKTIFVCGHSGEGYDVVINKADILAFKNYLSKVLKYVASQPKLGKTKDEIVKNTTSIPGAEEWKGEGISRPLTAAFDELSSPK